MKWIKVHLSKRHGERKDALNRGHGFGNRMFVEHIWWNLMGQFAGLHPEYEVKDWRGRSYYVDFMWIVGSMRFIFEIMDYGSHGTDRSKFRMDLNRELYLQSQDCFVIFISLDEMKESPTFVLAMIRGILAPYLAAPAGKDGKEHRQYSKIERQLMRLAIRDHRVKYTNMSASVLCRVQIYCEG